MTKKRIIGTGNFALDIIYQRDYPEGFDTAKKRNPFVDKKIIEEVGNTCGNVMCMLPYLGVETYPIGHFDESEQGLKITADLKRYGANTRFVKNSKEGGTTLMTCIHKLDANGQHIMSHRATAPNSRFPKRKQLRKDEVQGFVDALDFKPDAYFFDVSDAGPRELAKALKEQGVLVYYEPEGNKEMNKFLKCVEVSDVIKFSGTKILDTAFVADYPDKLFIRTMGEAGMEFNLRGQGWKKIAPVPNDNVVDWEGAGDWTSSVFLAELCKLNKLNIAHLTDKDVRQVLETAAATASRSVSYMGSKGMINKKIKQMGVRQNIETYYPEYAGWYIYPPDQCVPIRTTTDEWAILHNMTPCKVVVNGVTFKNTETLFQLFRFRDAEAVKDVYHKNNKIQAKLWDKLGYTRPDWGKMFLDALKFVLMQKYEQSEAFRNVLEHSRGLFIVEDESKRKSTSYGVKLKTTGFYEGSNLFGRLLMELRDNGKLEYKLPDDAFDFINILKQQ